MPIPKNRFAIEDADIGTIPRLAFDREPVMGLFHNTPELIKSSVFVLEVFILPRLSDGL